MFFEEETVGVGRDGVYPSFSYKPVGYDGKAVGWLLEAAGEEPLFVESWTAEEGVLWEEWKAAVKAEHGIDVAVLGGLEPVTRR